MSETQGGVVVDGLTGEVEVLGEAVGTGTELVD